MKSLEDKVTKQTSKDVKSIVNYTEKCSHAARRQLAGSSTAAVFFILRGVFEGRCQMYCKLQAKMLPRRHVGAPWNFLEAVLGLAGKHLGATWEASGEHLRAPWRLLEAILGLRGQSKPVDK